MIFANPNVEEIDYVTFNESANTVLNESFGSKLTLVDADDVPKDFQKMAYKILDAIKAEGVKNISGGAAENFKDSFNIFSDKVQENIENGGDNVRSYRFHLPQKFKVAFGIKLPADYIKLGAKIMTSAGLVKGKPIDEMNRFGSCYYKKSKTKSGLPCYFVAFPNYGDNALGVVSFHDTFLIELRCVSTNPKTTDLIESTNCISSEDALNHSEDQTTPNNTGFEGLTPETLYGFIPDQGLTRSEELASDSAYSDFFRDPKIMSSFTEHFDLSDSATRKKILTMNEAEQKNVLTALTSKLYDNIVTKIDDIDYGDIPSTKGDITKLSNYEKLRECIELLRGILTEFKQDTGPIDVVSEAMANVMSRKDLFGRAFKYNVELPIIMYNNTVLSIISGVSYMIATSIEFMKTPNRDSFNITLDKVAYSKTKSNMLYTNLKRFNKICSSGDFDKAIEHVLQNRIKGFGEGAIAAGIAAVTVGVALVLNIIPILREMVFFFYYTRMRVSDFFNIQADLLQMNAYNVEHSESHDDEKKSRIVSKQLKIVELFRKIANKISFTGKKAEVETSKEISSTSSKMRIGDLDIDSSNSVSALF